MWGLRVLHFLLSNSISMIIYVTIKDHPSIKGMHLINDKVKYAR